MSSEIQFHNISLESYCYYTPLLVPHDHGRMS